MRFVALLGLSLILGAQDLPNRWNATGSLLTPRHHACAAPLPGGRVLVMGGLGPEDTALASAEIYSAAEGVFSETAPMSTARVGHSCTALTDGRVLVVSGGLAELFDPATGAWVAPAGSSPAVAREGHTATLLPDGSVLLAGGVVSGGTATTGALERFDPATGSFILFEAGLSGPRAAHTAALLSDGRVIVAGGQAEPDSDALESTEIVDPYLQTVQTGPVLTEGGVNP